MKIPPSNSRGYKILRELAKGPATIYQGVERHGDMGIDLGHMRRLYDGLMVAGALLREGLVYRITGDALAQLADNRPAPDAAAAGVPAGPAYRGDWKNAPALNSASARRLGYAIGSGSGR